MSYGADRDEPYKRAALISDRILKGTKPTDLPVEKSRNFELLINLKTAKALGLTIPPVVLHQVNDLCTLWRFCLFVIHLIVSPLISCEERTNQTAHLKALRELQKKAKKKLKKQKQIGGLCANTVCPS